MKNVEFTIIVHPDETGGYWTEVPALPGCGSQGESTEEAVEMTKDAITGYLASLNKEGKAIPDEKGVVYKVTVPV
ncbi:MAG: type II toxin-antitoxin system HicB family antitoxin [Dehalococcoidia bacterium]|nr:type II toxin-antitoxin system HicB family antitoxin [Dehalococcoidia bacterium]